MNKKALLFISLGCFATQTLACDEGIGDRAENLALFTVLGLIVLSALLIPFTSLLQNQNMTRRQSLLLIGFVVGGLIISGALFYIDGHPYMRPGAVMLGFFTLFVPVATAFIQSLRSFMKRTE